MFPVLPGKQSLRQGLSVNVLFGRYNPKAAGVKRRATEVVKDGEQCRITATVSGKGTYSALQDVSGQDIWRHWILG